MTKRCRNALSATSTYLKLHIWIKIRWNTLTFMNCSSKTKLDLQVKYADNYIDLQLDDNINDIICYKKDPAQPNWKILFPRINGSWYCRMFHQMMGHLGKKRLRETLNKHYHHPKLHYHIDRLKYIDCQKHKVAGRSYVRGSYTTSASTHELTLVV